MKTYISVYPSIDGQLTITNMKDTVLFYHNNMDSVDFCDKIEEFANTRNELEVKYINEYIKWYYNRNK